MYCSNCGSYNNDNAEFCQNCGQRLQTQSDAGEEMPFAEQQPVNPVFTVPVFENTQKPLNPLYQILRKHASSKLFLAAIIFFGIGILLNITVNIISASMSWDEIIDRLPKLFQPALDQFTGRFNSAYMSYSYMQPEIPDALKNMVSAGTVISGLTGMIPVILIFTGMLMTYVSAAKSRGSGALLSTGGLTMIRVIQILSLIGVCIIAGLVLILMLILIPAATLMAGNLSEYMAVTNLSALALSGVPEGFASTLIIITFALLAVIFVFAIIYQAKLVSMLGKIKNFAGGGAPYIKPSMFVIVFGFIGAGLSALSSFGAFILSPVAGLSSLINAVAVILLLAVLCRYRSEIKAASAQNQPYGSF